MTQRQRQKHGKQQTTRDENQHEAESEKIHNNPTAETQHAYKMCKYRKHPNY